VLSACHECSGALQSDLVTIRTRCEYETIKLALDLVAWCGASDREGLESPNYALQEATPVHLVEVHEFLSYSLGLDAWALTTIGGDRVRAILSDAIRWVALEIVDRLTPTDPDQPF